jgi:hypothetical protein
MLDNGSRNTKFNCLSSAYVYVDSTNDNLYTKRTIAVCFNQDNLRILADYAKKKGMLGYSQAVEYLAKKTKER